MKNKIITFLQFLMIVISFLMISAHFYRANNHYLAYFLILVPFFLIIRKKYIVRFTQIILFLSSIEWWIVIYKIINIRRMYNMPWIRFSLIMSLVAVFTLLSIVVLESKIMKKIYR